jgi:polar amino acid transport system permease protein
MIYSFDFTVVAKNWETLATAAWLTVAISVQAMVGGLAIGIAGAFAKAAGPAPVRWFVNAFIELIRNTPLLAQLFLIFFALPQTGFRLSPQAAAVVGLSLNCGAYAIEIIRAGVEAVPRGQIEAGLSLGLRRTQVYLLIVLIPALQTVYPALSSQFIILLLSSSIVSSISIDELTSAAALLQMSTFRAFEVYFAVTIVYLFLSFAFRFVLNIIYQLWLERPRRILARFE